MSWCPWDPGPRKEDPRAKDPRDEGPEVVPEPESETVPEAEIAPEAWGDQPMLKLEIEITPDELEVSAVPDDEGGRGASVADLEALLFVAERPLSRAELRSRRPPQR